MYLFIKYECTPNHENSRDKKLFRSLLVANTLTMFKDII